MNPEMRNLYSLAETLGKTVPEILYGMPRPMTGQDYNYWLAYFKIKQEEQEAEERKSKSRGKASSSQQSQAEQKPTMGRS